jgi:hypothetical protein
VSEIDQNLKAASNKLKEFAEAPGDKVEIPEEDLVEIAVAITHKVNKDRANRGMLQPSNVDRALMEAEEKLIEVDE